MDDKPPGPSGGVFKPPSMKSAQQTMRKRALMASTLNAHSAFDQIPEDVQASTGELSLDNPTEQQQAARNNRHSIEQRSWEDYWDSQQQIDVPGRGSFNVYQAGSSGAAVFCLHGGGYTGLTWSLVAKHLKDKYRVVAPDLRSHGETTTADDLDFSAETMMQDVVEVWKALFAGSSERVPTLLVGHSMGGALAVWAAATKEIAGLDGVVVIDVVEGTALAALPHMMGVLNSRPAMFQSVQAAAEWAVRSGICKNRELAGLSLPSQLKQAAAGDAASAGVLTWRTPLAASRPHWEGWYRGLSDTFLSLPVPKMLLLAGTDRLDKSLTIGQMQGKFQLVLMPTAGHAIQEDEPGKTAEHLQQFLHRFRIGEPPMVIPRAPPGVRPVLPVAVGPLFVKDSTVASAVPSAAAGAAATAAAVAATGSGAPISTGQLAPQQ